MKMRKIPNRVAIIGCKNFSAVNLYSLLMNGVVEELILVENNCGRLIKEIAELQKSIPIGFHPRVLKGDYKKAASSKIIVIAAASDSNAGTPFESLAEKVETVREIVRNLKKHEFDGVILVAANPVDVLAQAALEESGLPAHKVIGSGQFLDTEKFRRILKNKDHFEKNENEEDVTWCAALKSSSPMIDYCQPNCPEFGKMIEADKRKPVAITRRKSSSLFSAGTCVTKICEAILRDERTILPVFTMAKGQYGIEGVYMNFPCIIRRDGVEDVLKLKISDSEKRELKTSSTVLCRTCEALQKRKNITAQTL